MADTDQNKIIVDDDWKSAAQAEKAKLAETEAPKEDPKGLPEQPGFEHLVSMLTSQALMYLGQIPDQSGRGMVALDVAKMQIDLLSVIEDKTKGNLSEDESKLLKGTVGELRSIFVEVAEAITKAQADGSIPNNPGQPIPVDLSGQPPMGR